MQQYASSLCHCCRAVSIKESSIKVLFSEKGYKHHRQRDLIEHARRGCALCQILHDGTKNIADRKRSMHLYLRAWKDDGEGDFAEKIAESERKIYLQVSIASDMYMNFMVSAEEDDAAAFFIKQRPPSDTVADATSYKQVRAWLSGCLETHSRCPRREIPYLPTRVIEIKVNGGNVLAKLRDAEKDERAGFVALSYCWGGNQPVTTTSATIEGHKQGFIVQTLPQTLQDAITVTQNLGFQYIWIDALCIIQDNPSDKAAEIGKMGVIYKTASLTICAGSSKCASEGFLQPRSSIARVQLPFLCPNDQHGIITLSPVTHYNARSEPLNSRAWTFQERILSPRVLFYGTHELSWQCQTDISKSATGFHPALTEGTKRLPSDIFLTSPSNDPSQEDTITTSTIRHERALLWIEIVEEYTTRALTEPEDKLLAILGVVKELGKVWRDDIYLAGMWRFALIHQMTWSRHRLPDRSFKLPDKYRAPTWSWAAIEGPVRMMMLEHVHAELIDVQVEYGIGEEAAKVIGGHLILNAVVLTLDMLRSGERSGKWLLDIVLDDDNEKKLDDEKASRTEIALLGTTFGIAVGIALLPATSGHFKRIGKCSTWRTGGARIDEDNVLSRFQQRNICII